MEWLKLIICIFGCQVVGILSSLFNIKSLPGWYSNLKKPKFNPPSWVFGPAWTILYSLMGISFYLVLISEKNITLAIIVFSIQLFLNFIWSGIFFGMRKPLLSFIEIILLWIAIILNIFVFYEISKVAAYLLIPYLLWVSFASILNLFIWKLNRKGKIGKFKDNQF